VWEGGRGEEGMGEGVEETRMKAGSDTEKRGVTLKRQKRVRLGEATKTSERETKK